MSILIEICQVTIEKMFRMCLQTDDRQYVIKKAHLSFQLRCAKHVRSRNGSVFFLKCFIEMYQILVLQYTEQVSFVIYITFHFISVRGRMVFSLFSWIKWNIIIYALIFLKCSILWFYLSKILLRLCITFWML